MCSNPTFPSMHKQLYKDILDKFTDASEKFDYMNKNILHLVCENNRCPISMLERVKMIMERFPEFDLNMTENTGETPLHLACQIDMKPLIGYLIEKGANPNAANNVR